MNCQRQRRLLFHGSLKNVWCCICLLAAMLFAARADGAESEPGIRIALLPVSEAELVQKMVDLAYPMLGDKAGMELVERSEIDLIQREQKLNQALSSPQQRLQIGKVLGADFLIFFQHEDETIMLRTVDCHTGCIVNFYELPVLQEEDLGKLVNQAANVLAERILDFSRVALEQLLPLSLPDLTCLNPESVAEQQLARRVKRRLLSRLNGHTHIICLERDEIMQARREINQFHQDTAEFWQSACIITGAAGLQGEQFREMFVALKLQLPDGERETLKAVTGPSVNLPELVETLAEQVLKKVRTASGKDTGKRLDRKGEAEFLENLAQIYLQKKAV